MERKAAHGYTPGLDAQLDSDRGFSVNIEVELLANERQTLFMLGQGNSLNFVSGQLGVEVGNLKTNLKTMRSRLGVNTNLGALRMAMQQRILSAQEILPDDYTDDNFRYLTPEQLDALNNYYDNHDLKSDEEIAAKLGLSAEDFLQDLYRGFGVINAKTILNAAVMIQAQRDRLIPASDPVSENEEIGQLSPDSPRVREVKRSISPRELEVFTLKAKGLINKEIAASMGVSEQTVKNHAASAFVKLGVQSSGEAIRQIIGIGLIDISELLPAEFDPSVMGEVSDKEAEIIKHLGTSGDSNVAIALRVGSNENTVGSRISKSMKKTGTVSREQIMVFYLGAKKIKEEQAVEMGVDPESVDPFDWRREDQEYEMPSLSPRELDVLRAVSRGLSNAEIAGFLGKSEYMVKVQMSSILYKLDARNRVVAVKKAIDLKLVDIGEITSDELELINSLSNREKELLELIASSGLSNKELAQHLGISKYTVNCHMLTLLGKLDVASRVEAMTLWIKANRIIDSTSEAEQDVVYSSEAVI